MKHDGVGYDKFSLLRFDHQRSQKEGEFFIAQSVMFHFSSEKTGMVLAVAFPAGCAKRITSFNFRRDVGFVLSGEVNKE